MKLLLCMAPRSLEFHFVLFVSGKRMFSPRIPVSSRKVHTSDIAQLLFADLT